MDHNENRSALLRFTHAVIGLFVVCIILIFTYLTTFFLLPFITNRMLVPSVQYLAEVTGLSGNILAVPAVLFFTFQNFLAYKISTHILEDEYNVQQSIFLAPLIFITAIPLMVVLYLLLVLEYIGRTTRNTKTRVILLSITIASFILWLLFR